MKKRIGALLLSLCLLVSGEPLTVIADSAQLRDGEVSTAATETAKKTVTVLVDGVARDSFYLNTDEKTMLMAAADFPIAGYQWQILADPSLDLWVNILDRTDAQCEVSMALLESVLTGGGTTALRCVVKDYLGDRVIGEAVTVTVVDPTAFAVQTLAQTETDEPVTTAEDGDDETTDYVTVTIKYLFAAGTKKAGQAAAKEYVAKIVNAQWTGFSQTISSPAVVGYTPDQSSVTITGGADTKDVTFQVYYEPAKVNYTIRYFFQNIYNDEYEDKGFVVRQALTERSLDAADLAYDGGTPTGFYDMYFATEDVAADGSTVVECYFDRQYYLIRFDCNEGYGTDPIFARYGTTFAVNDPVRYGYSFKGWTLANDEDFTGDMLTGLQNSVPAVIAAWPEAPVYQAQWEQDPSAVSYKIAYWGVSGGTKYLLGTKVVGGATAGEKVSGQDDLFEATNYLCGQTEHREHVADCYGGHTHTVDCFGAGVLTTETLQNTDATAFEAMKTARQEKDPDYDFEDGYLYIVSTKAYNYNDCWPKIRIGGNWYKFSSNSGSGDASLYSGLTVVDQYDYEPESTGWRITKYLFQLDDCAVCGLKAHTHTDDCSAGNYLKFQSADQDVEVKGDHSTVVNVYYEYKQYTLRFYYARSYVQETATDGTEETIYQVVGGSTYYFGSWATNADSTSAAGSVPTLLGNVGSWGKVANEPKLKEDYINNSDLQTKYQLRADTAEIGDHTYYYLEFTAGFGTDISDVWPVDVLESVKVAEAHTDANHGGDDSHYCNYEYAYFSAWNGQYGVYYSHHNGNQTIKGAYQYLDENLIFDKAFPGYADETTVSYLCFWENGANVDWSIPKVFDYKLYKECLPSDPDPDDAIKVDGAIQTVARNDKTYYLFKDFYVYDNSGTGEQTAIQLDGYKLRETVSGPDGETIEMDGAELTYYSIDYYYDALTDVKISFYNYNGELASVSGIAYGTSLKDGLSDKTVEGWSFFDKGGNVNTPPYPTVLESGAYEFMGWYTTADCLDNSKYDLTTATMPSTDLMLYAKWQKKTHTVTFYNTLDDLRNGETAYATRSDIIHGNTVGSDVTMTGGDENTGFIGWFYLDSNGSKCFFSPLSTPVKSDMQVYAEWRTTETVQYTIHYRFVDETGAPAGEAAADTVGYAFVNSTKTFKAAAVNGAFPEVASHSMVISGDPAENEYTFYYRQSGNNSYTVQYVNKVDMTVMKTETVENVSDAVVTVKYEHFDNMIPDATYKQLILSADPTQNVITFYYTYSETQTVLTVHHMLQSLDGSSYEEDTDARNDLYVTLTGESTTTTLMLQKITGFTAAGYADSETGTQTAIAEDATTIELIVSKAGTEVYLFYTRNRVNYVVKHLIYGTSDPVEGLAATTDTAYYGATVTVDAAPPSGFTVVGNASYTWVIAANESSNTILFYYQKNNCTIYYAPVVDGQVVDKAGWLSISQETVSTSDEIKGCTASSDHYYTFNGWYKDKACTDSLTTEETITKENMAGSDGIDVTKTDYTFYAKFTPEKGDLTLNISFVNITAGQKILLKMVNQQTDEAFCFVVTAQEGSVTLNIKLVDVNKYTLSLGDGWSAVYQGTAEVTVRSGASASLTIENNGAQIWLIDYTYPTGGST